MSMFLPKTHVLKRRPGMAVKYTTAEDVKQFFADAFPTTCQPYDPDRWARLERAIIAPAWESDGQGIEVLQANGARLFRVRWEFVIDNMDTSSESKLRSIAAALRQRLATLFNGESVSFAIPESETQQQGPATVVRCWTRGIIG